MNFKHTIAALRLIFIEQVIAMTGYDKNHVILANQNQTRPTLPYVVIKIQDRRRVGFDSFVNVNIGTEDTPIYVQRQQGVREFNVDIQAFGPESWDACADITDALQTDQYIDEFRGAGVVIYDMENARDISWVDNSKFKERHQMTLNCRAAIQIDNATDVIDTIEINGTIKHDYDDPSPITFSMEVTDVT